MITPDFFMQHLNWTRSDNAEFPFTAVSHDGQQLMIRLNDFPAEPMYTLLIDSTEISSFDDWPQAWVRP